MSDDKMRAEFESYAEQRNWNVMQYHGSYYWAEAARGWQVWQAACQAGQKAEQAEVERLRGLLRDVLDNDRYEELHNNSNLDDELKQRIRSAIENNPEGER